MFNNNKRQVFASKMNKVNSKKVRDELILSIQKNVVCIDFLEELINTREDIFKFSEERSDEIEIEKLKWIKFQIEYNVDMFNKSLKKLGGSVSDVKSFEWK